MTPGFPLFVAATLVATCAAMDVAETQTPVFSARVDAVRVDVSVTERGQVVRGLQPRDFELRDNGVLQQIELVSFEQLPLNVLLALDLSQSVSGDQLRDLKAAGGALLDGLAPADKAALLTFSHRLTLGSALTSEVSLLRSALDGLTSSGDTSLFDATFAALLLGARDPGRDLLVVFSDGRDTASWLSADQVLEAAKRLDVVAYGVTLRGAASGPFLRRLADETGGQALDIDSTRALQAHFVEVLEGFRRRYLVSYSPGGVERGGWHRLEVKIKGRRATVRARPGYVDR